MSAEVIHGLNGMTIVGHGYRDNKAFGQTKTVVYEGPYDKALESYQTLKLSPSVDEVDLQPPQGGVSRLVVRYVDSDDPNTEESNAEWELIGSDLLKDIRNHDRFNKDADQDDLNAIRKAVTKGDSYTPSGSPETEYYALLVRGTTHYVRSMFGLRKTLIVGSRSVFRASFKNIDRAVVFSDVGISGARHSDILSAIPEMPGFDSSKKQWLVRPPSIHSDRRGLVTLQQEYQFAERWSETLYEGDQEDGNP